MLTTDTFTKFQNTESTMRIFFLFLILLISTKSYEQVNLSQGLIAHFPFNGNANDISGNALNGVISNAMLTADKDGSANSAYYFNGVNSYITLPFSNLYNLNPQDSFSISVWILPDLGNPWPAQSLVVKAPYNPDFNLSSWNYGSYMLNYKAMSGYAYNHVLNGTSTLSNDPCWYNIITTYKNGVWKLYVNGALESSDLSQTKFILKDGNSKIVIGRKGESSGDYYKGKMDEIRLYNRVLNIEEVSAIVGNCRLPCSTKNDFSFSFNPCNPNNVSFLTSATGYNNIRWDFGDGNTASSTTSPQNTYSSQGNYVVTMITDYATCTDTVTKTITIAIQNDNLLVSTNDTTICNGQTKQLLASSGLSYCWSPSTYLSNTSISNPVTSTPQSITYYLQSLVSGNNLITNGDFSAGNTGFTSQYHYTPNNTTEGEYYVGTNPQAWYPAHHPCTDHTSGNGRMLLVNGSPTPNVEVWRTTVPVAPNTNYSFSTWICSISSPNPAQLSFSINGNSIGGLINASLPTCTWSQFYTVWNSGSDNTATISIVNKNIIAFGNDFALDDISFSPITIRRDSVRIIVDTPLINATHHANICLGDTVHLNVTGAVTYSWSPPTGLTNASISNPVASPAANTTYVATGINANGCADTDTVRIAVRIPVPFTVNPPVSLCKNLPAQLTAAGGDTYLWSPANLLSNSVISNPLATASSTTTFSVLITDTLCNNSSTLSTTVNVFPDPNIIINKSNDIDCSHLSATLSASGGASYSWAPSNTLNNPNLPNPVASPKVTTDYIVTVTDANDCTNKDSITVYVTDSNKGDYLMPSGFTPNNDGLNDCFGIKYWGLIEKLEFSIYNRWGERVFFTTDPAGCWDGTYKGQQQDGAVFVYMIKAKTACQDNIFRKGTFVLIR